MRRMLLTVATGLALIGAVAPAASAHGLGGTGASNYLTVLDAVEPRVAGVRIRVIELGSRLELTNRTGRDVVVMGYDGEPYLRIGPRGIFTNQNSPATFLNAGRDGGAVPPATDPEEAPVWQRQGGGTTARWHDHRTHWMGRQDPPAVRRDRGRSHVVIPRWRVPMTSAGRTFEARGHLLWAPGPSPLPWLGLAVVIAVPAAAAGTHRRRRTLVGVAVAALLVIDVAHAVAASLDRGAAAGGQGGQALGGNAYSLIGWAAAGLGIWMLRRRPADAWFVVGAGAVMIALFGGVADLSDLSRSQIPVAWPATTARAMVSLTIGLGAGIAGACALASRRSHSPSEPPSTP
ncbi:MAG TPA: hypothetical protein VM030_04790 [Acidimicrobiales bacterium]|nr:hypothetical protein [Acidimicrobiales bacterium]